MPAAPSVPSRGPVNCFRWSRDACYMSCSWFPARCPAKASNGSGPITPGRSSASRCATACDCTRWSTRLRPLRRQYPILLERTPYGAAPARREQLSFLPGTLRGAGPRRLHLRVPGRAGPLPSEGTFVEMRPQLTGRAWAAGHRREHRHLRHHRLAAQEHPRPQRPRGPVRHLLPRLLRRGGAAVRRIRR